MENNIDIEALQAALQLLAKNSSSLEKTNKGLPPAPPMPPVVKGLWYNKKVIKVDGWSFEGCRFDSCLLIVESPYFSFKDCYIDDSNALEFKGAVMKLFQLSDCIPIKIGSDELKPFRNLDGTVSIGLANEG